MKITLTLPIPPSVNSLFRGGKPGQQRFKSREYKDWIEHATILLGQQQRHFFDKDASVHYAFFFPDRRAGDCENYQKAITDLLVSNAILEDDKHTILTRGSYEFAGYDSKNPRVEIVVEGACTTNP